MTPKTRRDMEANTARNWRPVVPPLGYLAEPPDVGGVSCCGVYYPCEPQAYAAPVVCPLCGQDLGSAYSRGHPNTLTI